MTRARLSPVALGYVLGLLGIIAFGGTFPMTKLAVQWFEPLALTFWRPGLAGVLALALLVATRSPLPPRALWRPLAIAALCLVWGFPGLGNVAMRLVSSSHAGVIVGVLPLTTAVAAALILKERQPPAFWLIAIAGAAFVVGFAALGGDAASGASAGAGLSPGDGVMLAAIAVCAVGYVYSAHASRSLPGWAVISWLLVATLPVNLVGMASTWPGLASIQSAPWSALIGVAYVALISQFIGFFAWNSGLALGGVARVGQVQLLQSFVTLAFAALAVGEVVPLRVWLSACVVVGLVVLSRRLSR